MIAYHDREWGSPVHDDRVLFEFLLLEGAQAGLSWDTILKKREHYRVAFAGFEPRRVAAYTERDVARLLSDPGIVRNRLKVRGAIENARAFLRVQEEAGSFDAYLRAFLAQREAPKALADRISRDLRKRGFRFVGPTIVHAFLQAVGVVNDHSRSCFRRFQVRSFNARGPRARTASMPVRRRGASSLAP